MRKNEDNKEDVPTNEEIEAAGMDAVGPIPKEEDDDAELVECPADSCSVCPERSTCPDREEVEAGEQEAMETIEDAGSPTDSRFRAYYHGKPKLTAQQKATFHRLVNYASRISPENENLSKPMVVTAAKRRLGELSELLLKTIDLDDEVVGAGADTSHDLLFTAVSIGQEIGNIASILPTMVLE